MSDEDNKDSVAEPVLEIPETVDVTIYESKIAALSDDLAARDLTIADLNEQLNKSKAANYDLLMSTPGDNAVNTDDVVAEPNVVTIDSLFD